MKLTLNPNGFTAKLWRSTYNRRLPQSLCPYFWTTLLAYILAIPSWPGHLINAIVKWSDNEGDEITAYWSAFHVPFCLGVGASLIDATNNTPLYKAYLAGILLLIIIGVAFFVIGFIVMFCKFIMEEYDEYKFNRMYKKGLVNEYGELLNREPKVKKPGMVKTYIKAFLGKYCPQIEWKSNAK